MIYFPRTCFILILVFSISYISLSQGISAQQKIDNDLKKNLFFNFLQQTKAKFEKNKKEKSKSTTKESIEENDSPDERMLEEYLKMINPNTLEVPIQELLLARDEIDKSLRKYKGSRLNNGLIWNERGPNNIGGRTRALMFDPNDVSAKKAWAGGVAGGLWYNNDITSPSSYWNRVDDFWDNIAISCITYSPMSPQTFYVGTGEGWGGDNFLNGGGIWKSVNGGVSWNRLINTSSFNSVQAIAVANNGDIYAGTDLGLQKSTDGGNTWITVLTGFISDLKIATDGVIYTSLGSLIKSPKIYKSVTGNLNSWTDITPTVAPNELARVAFALSKNSTGNNQIIYAVAANSGSTVLFFKKSINAGLTWTDLPVPMLNGTAFTGNQGWYDLSLGVNPTNDNILFAGGLAWAKSINGGQSWIYQPEYSRIHPDQHILCFRPNNPNEVIIGNDGGVYYSSTFGSSTSTSLDIGPYNETYPELTNGIRNTGYNVTQYYSVALKNINGDGTLIGGSQDNGTHRITNASINNIGSGIEIFPGDGILSFIDQNDPTIQIASYIGAYYRKVDPSQGYPNGNNISLLPSEGIYSSCQSNYVSRFTGGYFQNPADYNSVTKTLYAYCQDRTKVIDCSGSESDGIVAVSNINGSTPSYSFINLNTLHNTIKGVNSIGDELAVCIKVGKSSNTLFYASITCKLYKITNINTSNPVMTRIDNSYFPGGSISSIELGADDNEIIITISNPGASTSSIWYTNNGGNNWINKDVDGSYWAIPSMTSIAIFDAKFNPLNRKQVFIGTDAGVWSTDDITASNPQWTLNSTGLSRTRCIKLAFRTADNLLAVATHGRGFFTTQSLGTCINNATINNYYGDGSNLTFLVSNALTALNKIENNAIIYYQAGGYIQLNDGFLVTAASSSDFKAQISNCTSSSARQVEYDFYAEKKNPESQLSIYPNPATTAFRIEYLIENKGRVKVEIVNLEGESVMIPIEEGEHSEGIFQKDINISQLVSGHYIVVLKTTTQTASKHLTVVK